MSRLKDTNRDRWDDNWTSDKISYITLERDNVARGLTGLYNDKQIKELVARVKELEEKLERLENIVT